MNSPGSVAEQSHEASHVGVEWLGRKGSWSVYIGLLLCGRYLVSFFGFDESEAWTLVNVLHCLVTFFTFHWVKGNPFPTYWLTVPENEDKYTWWEQLDQGWQFTRTRKFCIFLVIVLYVLAVDATPWNNFALQGINFIAFAVAVVAKMPWMDKVRLFGINK